MNEHCGQKTAHRKIRGKIHRCDWCGQKIEIGDKYEKWLYFECGTRSTVYAHKECSLIWEETAREDGEMVFADGSCKRPEVVR